MIKKLFFAICVGLLAVNSISAILPQLPETTDITALKRMFKKAKAAILPQADQLEFLVTKYEKESELAEDLKHIRLYINADTLSSACEDDMIKKYQIAIGMLKWYKLQMLFWIHELEARGQDFHITYLK